MDGAPAVLVAEATRIFIGEQLAPADRDTLRHLTDKDRSELLGAIAVALQRNA